MYLHYEQYVLLLLYENEDNGVILFLIQPLSVWLFVPTIMSLTNMAA